MFAGQVKKIEEMIMIDEIDSSLEARARRHARRFNLKAIKSRRRLSVDNRGRFMLIDPMRNTVAAGLRFDLSAEEVIELCRIE